ncbi:protoheme IX farnesyltransferase [Pseudoalteromonas sp. McH1-7]|uniref:Protoheme IX farnesyltransferase n=1 Tax=Pseudoalteromonas peptidolytica F12-50-A1 TaxID=1315280 RepID=A0A8I0MXP6_9GAMM|nr:MULTISPECIES: heme o synthase [Pseudoalteromonas]MBE0347810.1 protoheme IX farnesyltransferase [Pseudoalteromonas peptidolytica F12-50-A1]NLR17169.1 protoheme IX farnesyltransferase [Pseudoalteromonas peptidolytica]NUZ13008.1 protoheme IX farnesyltransferase [Pseudoalteromonas sp. McH1-7]RRS07280.1 protoheme IX farnesyltransferase [Pseudoalteromonas sp. J010]RXF01419.1 protoheme IX farnesyltransferase [Pseudoalteromonas sp. PS5]
MHQLTNTFEYQRITSLLKAYFGMCKFKVVCMLVITAWVGLALAPQSDKTLLSQIMSLLGIGLLSSSAAAINHVVDREIDKKMVRTRDRPLATESVSVSSAIMFASTLALFGYVLLSIFANQLCALLTLAALVGYAVVYTLLLKRATPQNIVIGGLAGAMPPLLGWVSETGQLGAEPWLLVMIIFAWTPPHFWALAIARKRDYEKAEIPMLPVTHGDEFTKLCVLFYTILLTVICLLPYLVGMSGWIYLLCSGAVNVAFIYKAAKLIKTKSLEYAMRVFYFSIWHLLIVFVALFVDKAFI